MMHLTTQGSNQLQTIFGGGYVVEQHIDGIDRCFPYSNAIPTSSAGEACESLTRSMFDEVMESLRSALSLH